MSSYVTVEHRNSFSRGYSPAPVRQHRAVSLSYVPRQVEIIREPYDSGEVEFQSKLLRRRQQARATSVALGEEPIYVRHKPPLYRQRSNTPLPLGNPWHTAYSNVSDSVHEDVVPSRYSTSRYTPRYLNGIGSTYRPSFWYIGTAGFSEDSSAERARRMQSRADGILTYQPPPSDYYLSLRSSLRDINDKMREHRQLVDRYAGVEMTPLDSVESRIQRRYQDMVDRMPEIESSSNTRLRSRAISEEPFSSRSRPPIQQTSTSSGNYSSSNSQASAVRGKIRKILGKSRQAV